MALATDLPCTYELEREVYLAHPKMELYTEVTEARLRLGQVPEFSSKAGSRASQCRIARGKRARFRLLATDI